MDTLLTMPLFWAMLTIAFFLLGQKLYAALGNSAFAPPILTGLVLVVLTLYVTGTSFEQYMEGGQYLHLMLGPVVVMLAVPLYQFFHAIRKDALRIFLAVTLGSGVTVGVAVALTIWWVADHTVVASVAAKSVTTAVAVVLTEEMGGIAALASVCVMITGFAGVVVIPPLLRAAKLDQPKSMGLSLGVCAHAIGTSYALEMGEEQAAYSAMAMTLTATLHAIVLPLII